MAKRTVVTTMTGFPVPSTSSSSPGAVMDANRGPFSKPHDTGGGGIPMKFFEGPSTTAAARQVETSGQSGGGFISPGYTGGQERSREKASVPKNNK